MQISWDRAAPFEERNQQATGAVRPTSEPRDEACWHGGNAGPQARVPSDVATVGLAFALFLRDVLSVVAWRALRVVGLCHRSSTERGRAGAVPQFLAGIFLLSMTDNPLTWCRRPHLRLAG